LRGIAFWKFDEVTYEGDGNIDWHEEIRRKSNNVVFSFAAVKVVSVYDRLMLCTEKSSSL